MYFRKALNTIPRTLLWQMLEDLGVHGRFVDIIKSLYAHDSAAVRMPQGLSKIFRCLTGVKQGCPLSPILFGLHTSIQAEAGCCWRCSHILDIKNSCSHDVCTHDYFAKEYVSTRAHRPGLGHCQGFSKDKLTGTTLLYYTLGSDKTQLQHAAKCMC